MHEELMIRLAAFLNDHPRAIDLEEAKDIARTCGIGEEKAVALMLAAAAWIWIAQRIRQPIIAAFHLCCISCLPPL